MADLVLSDRDGDTITLAAQGGLFVKIIRADDPLPVAAAMVALSHEQLVNIATYLNAYIEEVDNARE